MRYRIVNWREYQHYGQRCPPWIKLHNALLASPTWVMGDDASRVLAVACMLLASRDKTGMGEFDGTPEYVRRVAVLSQPPDFQPLLDSEFIAPAPPPAPPFKTETEREAEAERAGAREASTMLADAGAALPSVAPTDDAAKAFHALCGLRPEYASLDPAAFKAAWQTEGNHKHRARAFNQALAALAGKLETDMDPLRLVTIFLRNARKHKPEGGPRDVMAEED